MHYLAGTFIAIFLILLLATKRKGQADWVLMGWLTVLSIHTALYYLDVTDQIKNYGHLAGVSIPFPLLHGPLLFLYTTLLIDPLKNAWRYWWHFAPFLIINLALLPFYQLPVVQKVYIFENEGVGYESFVFINSILILLSGLTYATICLVMIRKHKASIKNKLSSIEGKTLDWLLFLTLGLGIIWLLVAIGMNDLIFSGVVLFIILIGIFGIRQHSIFSNQPNDNTDDPLNLTTKKYEKSGLNDQNKIELVRRLEQLITEDKPFLEPELSLDELARRVHAQPNYLSQVLNEHFQLNFYDFINSKRVDEFCLKMNDPRFSHYKLVEIAYQSGFNSKSSFNRNFQRFKKTTPSDYKRHLITSQ